ncbi:co-chaperone GroES [Patescibacteria group bacterium]|nr:co-chaperone GroES [Patescibacteria group bacterium]
MAKLKPLYDNVVILPIEKEEKTKSGILLPEKDAKEKPEQGKVVAVGEGKLKENGEIQKLSVKIGDKVLFKSYIPSEIEVEEEKYLILRESDILAILE